MPERIYISQDEHARLIRLSSDHGPIATGFGGNRVWLSEGCTWPLPYLKEWRQPKEAPMQPDIEKLAEALSDAVGMVWDRLPDRHDAACGHGMPEGCKQYWRALAKAGLTALTEQGFAVVPVEPTVAMIAAGLPISDKDSGHPEDVYLAMLAAHKGTAHEQG